MNEKHTYGPWEVVRTGRGPHDWQIVARTPMGAAIYIADVSPVVLISSDEHEANARLIAAAPGLLAALSMLVTIHEQGGVEHYYQPWEEARRVITQARGAAVSS